MLLHLLISLMVRCRGQRLSVGYRHLQILPRNALPLFFFNKLKEVSRKESHSERGIYLMDLSSPALPSTCPLCLERQ